MKNGILIAFVVLVAPFAWGQSDPVGEEKVFLREILAGPLRTDNADARATLVTNYARNIERELQRDIKHGADVHLQKTMVHATALAELMDEMHGQSAWHTAALKNSQDQLRRALERAAQIHKPTPLINGKPTNLLGLGISIALTAAALTTADSANAKVNKAPRYSLTKDVFTIPAKTAGKK